ncbi:hypothetical protein HZS_4873 [Henneguya salminicola]|nr:hypothetical protein HZS_4873 [Henneguya salminicola]
MKVLEFLYCSQLPNLVCTGEVFTFTISYAIRIGLGDKESSFKSESIICKRKYKVNKILPNQEIWFANGICKNLKIFMELTTSRN